MSTTYCVCSVGECLSKTLNLWHVRPFCYWVNCMYFLANLQCWTVDVSFVFLTVSLKALGSQLWEETAVLTRYIHDVMKSIYYVITVLQTSRCYSPRWHDIGLWNIVYLDYLLRVSFSSKYLSTREREKTVILLPPHFLSGRLALCHVNKQRVLLFWCCREDCDVWDLAMKST